MQDELSSLYRLAAPHFPKLGEVFVAVSAGTYGNRGIPMFYGEFFIFSTKDADQAVGQRAYLQSHLAVTNEGKSGLEYLFGIARSRASAELTDEIVKRLALSDDAQFATPILMSEATWDDVQTLFRAGVMLAKPLSTVADRSRSALVTQAIQMIVNERQVSFEEAKDID